MEQIDELRASMLQLTSMYDVLLTPVAPAPACLHGEWIDLVAEGAFRFTELHNLTGWPSAVIPIARSACSNLPIGVQIAAAPWRDGLALRVASFLEDTFGGWQPLDQHALNKLSTNCS